MNTRTALITGVTGQDGSYLAESLLAKGYAVHGITRRTSAFSRDRIEQFREHGFDSGGSFELHYADLGDFASLSTVIAKTRPDELYNFAAQSHVGISFQQPEYTTDVVGLGVLRLLEAVRNHSPHTRFYQASTSDLFGAAEHSPQNENTPFRPLSPYAAAKAYAHWIVDTYRKAHGLFACNGILFNHESPRRGENFVTRKITLTLARIKAGLDETLHLGDLDAKRDWGYAADYMEAVWTMLRQDEPDDYVVATGRAHSVRQFVERAAGVAGFELEWEGAGLDEIGRDRPTGRIIVRVDPRYTRPVDVANLVGDATKARRQLGWRPAMSFDALVETMMLADLSALGLASPAPRELLAK